MEKKNVINATMFIVPNDTCSLAEQVEWEEKISKRKSETYERLKNIFGEDLNLSDRLVRIWVFEDENSGDENWSGNWSDHGRDIPEWDEKLQQKMEAVDPKSPEWDSMDDEFYYNEWPSWLPLSKIRHLNDGDTLEVEWKGCTIKLKVDQLNTRYGKITGTFQECLRDKLGVLY